MVNRRKDTNISLKPLSFDQVIRELARAPKQKLEECEPGATKAQVFEALHVLATTKVIPKPSPKKCS